MLTIDHMHYCNHANDERRRLEGNEQRDESWLQTAEICERLDRLLAQGEPRDEVVLRKPLEHPLAIILARGRHSNPPLPGLYAVRNRAGEDPAIYWWDGGEWCYRSGGDLVEAVEGAWVGPLEEGWGKL